MGDSKTLESRLAGGEVVLLDGAIGTELERLGAPMHNAAWCATALDTHRDLVREVHRSYLAAGADVITANTYATTRLALESGGLVEHFREWNELAMRLARESIEDAGRPAVAAGSVSTFGNFGRLDAKALTPMLRQQADILVGTGADLLILESLGATSEVIVAAVESLSTLSVPVWVAMSCLIDRETDEVYLGVEESQTHSKDPKRHEPFGPVVDAVAECGGSALLVMHSDLKATRPALEVLREHYPGVRGAYPNAGYWLRPEWAFVDQVSPEDYTREAEGWRETGAQILGGCCGIGPTHIEALHRTFR